jgi:hypothetical protein
LPQTYTPEDISNKFTIFTSRNWNLKPNRPIEFVPRQINLKYKIKYPSIHSKYVISTNNYSLKQRYFVITYLLTSLYIQSYNSFAKYPRNSHAYTQLSFKVCIKIAQEKCYNPSESKTLAKAVLMFNRVLLHAILEIQHFANLILKLFPTSQYVHWHTLTAVNACLHMAEQ